MSDPVAELHTLIADQPANPLRPYQIQALTEERRRHERSLSAPEWHGVNKSRAAAAMRRIDTMLRTQAPKPLEPERRDRVVQKTREVLETVIKPALLPQEIMRRNPAGAVDRYLKGEGSRRVKRAILAAKAAMRAVEPDNDDRDYTNFETLRPSLAGTAGATATFMAEAQIPGTFAMTPQAKANWPLGGPQVKTALDGAWGDAAPAPHPNASYRPEEDQQARAAKAAGLDTVPRQCQVEADGTRCATFFEASTRTPNPRRYCDAHKGQRWTKRTKAAQVARAAQAEA